MVEQLEGGIDNAGKVVREGDAVLRPAPANAETLHALFEFLASSGFPSPRPIGFRGDGREALKYIPGETSTPPYHPHGWVTADETLIEIGRVLRTLHDTTRDFVTARYWVPLRDPTSAAATNRDHLDPFARVRVLVDGYGADAQIRRDFTVVLMEIEEVALRFVVDRVNRGIPSFVEMWNDLGAHTWHHRKMTWLTDNQSRIDDALAA